MSFGQNEDECFFQKNCEITCDSSNLFLWSRDSISSDQSSDSHIKFFFEKRSHVVTPAGSIQKYDVETNVISLVSENAPSDVNAPYKLNNRSANRGNDNIVTLDHITFDSDKARTREGYLIVRDLETGKDYGVIRNEDGSYDWKRSTTDLEAETTKY